MECSFIRRHNKVNIHSFLLYTKTLQKICKNQTPQHIAENFRRLTQGIDS